jgi:large subunit ribosomal protein L18
MSKSARLVIRRSNNYVIAQIVTSDIAQDKVIIGASSRDLLAHGWPKTHAGSLKGLAASYLTGMLLASKAKASVKSAVLDMGMQRNVKKGRVYAALRGVIDGGIQVPHNPASLPDDKRIEHNTKTRELFIKMKGNLGHGGKRN